MSHKPRLGILIAAAALVSACGGGGGGDSASTAAGNNNAGNTVVADTSALAPTPGGNSTSNAGSGTTTPPSTDAGNVAGTTVPNGSGTSGTGNTGTTGTTGNTGDTGNTGGNPINTGGSGDTSTGTGGTGGNTGNTGGTSGTGGNTSSTPPTTTPGTGTTTPGTGTTTPGTGTTAPSSEETLRGNIAMVASQLVYIKGDRSIYFPITLNQFESGIGLYDAAAGSRVIDTTSEDVRTYRKVAAPFAAPAAPLAAFGFRIDKFVRAAADGQSTGNQTVVGRVAFNFTEVAGSAGIGANEVAENVRFVIDKVELSTSASGELISARVLEGAQMVLTGRSAAGASLAATLPVPASTVRFLPLWQVLDHEGDTSSFVLLVDLEAAFSQAGQSLAALEMMRGQFNLQVTTSLAQIERPAITTGSSPVVRRELVGQPITVGTQPTVTGAGVSGTAWIRMYPPQ